MIPSSVRILICTVPQDMRRSFDTLAAVVHDLLGEDPQSGTLYVFVGKRPVRVKVLWWDRNGYCLLAKRLHRAFFEPPPKPTGGGQSVAIDGAALKELLAGVAREGKRDKSGLH
jgi:transposase